MLQLTKIFHFEMAHAIDGYQGPCKNIHGHSYKLLVTVAAVCPGTDFIPAPGFIMDFKELKKIVKKGVIEKFDHKLALSDTYLKKHSMLLTQENLFLFEAEPTAENLLLYIRRSLASALPAEIKLTRLQLHETKDSFAEWINDETSS